METNLHVLLYKLIREWYDNLQNAIIKEEDLSIQFWLREHLNETIRLYKYYGGTANIDKYMKYYV